MEKKFLENYLNDFTRLALLTTELISALAQINRVLVEVSENGNKIIIVGNGGSAAIASHFSVDLTKSVVSTLMKLVSLPVWLAIMAMIIG
jgi:D-sedoheptulose 7-phosphate isomerase